MCLATIGDNGGSLVDPHSHDRQDDAWRRLSGSCAVSGAEAAAALAMTRRRDTLENMERDVYLWA